MINKEMGHTAVPQTNRAEKGEKVFLLCGIRVALKFRQTVRALFAGTKACMAEFRGQAALSQPIVSPSRNQRDTV